MAEILFWAPEVVRSGGFFYARNRMRSLSASGGNPVLGTGSRQVWRLFLCP
jgi:hypothetical protein